MSFIEVNEANPPQKVTRADERPQSATDWQNEDHLSSRVKAWMILLIVYGTIK